MVFCDSTLPERLLAVYRQVFAGGKALKISILGKALRPDFNRILAGITFSTGTFAVYLLI